MVTGVAAGVAAALASAEKKLPREVDVNAVQSKLRALGMDLDLLQRLGPCPTTLS